MKSIVKGSSILTGVSIGEMAIRFVRTKCIALVLGPSGTGFFTQLVIFFEALRTLGDLGSRRGVIKQVAEQRFTGEATPAYRKVLVTSFFLMAVSALTVGAAVVIFSPAISRLLFQDPSYYRYVIFLGILLPLACIATLMASIVKGNMDFISFARYTLGAYALVFVVTPVVTYFFKEWGAVMAMALFFVAPLFSYLLLNARRPFLHFGGRVDLPALREQFSFGLAQIYQDALTHVMRIVIAAWIVHGLGLSTLGIYQVVMTFTTVYMSIPIQATSGYVLPLIAGARNNEEVGTALNDSVRFLMFALVPIVIFIAVVPELLILLCYSKDFEPAVPYLQVQLIGTLFVLMGYSYSAALSGKGKLKAIAIISSIYCGIMLGVARLLFPRWGLMGVSVGVSAAAVANYLMHIYAARHYFGARTAPKNVRLVSMTLLWAGLAFVGLAFFDGIASRALILAFAPVWFWVSSKDHERHFMWELAGRCFKSFFRKGVPLVQKPVS